MFFVIYTFSIYIYTQKHNNNGIFMISLFVYNRTIKSDNISFYQLFTFFKNNSKK